ncbi:LysR family transcriptional regulator [Calidifontibacter terrae]
MGAAANHLGYTPSAVSQHLAALQKETKLSLVERSGRGIVPTAAGLELATRSEELMGSLARLDGFIEDLRAGRTETVTVSTFASAGEEWMPSVAATVMREFPAVQFAFRLNENGVLPPQAPDIELRTEVPGSDPTRLEGYERHLLTTEPYVVLMSADHPLAGQAEVRLADLAQSAWIDDDPARTNCGVIVERSARSAGFTPRFVAQAGDHHTAIAFVAAGIGVAVIPDLAARHLPAGVVARPVVDPAPQRRIVAFVHRQTLLHPAGRRILQLLEQHCPN